MHAHGNPPPPMYGPHVAFAFCGRAWAIFTFHTCVNCSLPPYPSAIGYGTSMIVIPLPLGVLCRLGVVSNQEGLNRQRFRPCLSALHLRHAIRHGDACFIMMLHIVPCLTIQRCRSRCSQWGHAHGVIVARQVVLSASHSCLSKTPFLTVLRCRPRIGTTQPMPSFVMVPVVAPPARCRRQPNA